MPLSPSHLNLLSRLLDEMLALEAGQRAAWLEQLAPEHVDLLPHLRRALDDHASLTPGFLSALPPVPGIEPAEDGSGNAGDRVGPYRLVSEIGRGGMGAVWLAERADGMYAREVALKLPRLSRGPQLAGRMARERQIGARLEHPNIARLYDAGIDESGRPYLVMERIVGTGLAAHCAEHGCTQARRIGLLLQVCVAVAYAHRHLVIHRDLKPSNLMVTSTGQVKLLDFGIAKLLDADGSTEISGSDVAQRTHTPGYAAPEQLAGSTITTATDQYALGVVLHELLTGELPSLLDPAGATPSATLGSDLRAVLARTLRTDQAQRYSSVERFADDLQRVLDLRPVQARDAGMRHRVALFGRRHRAALVGAALLVTASALTAVTLWRQNLSEQAHAQRAAQASDFVLDLVEEVEPVAGVASDEPVRVQMVEAGLARAEQNFPGQPVLQGQVLLELGLMLGRLHRPERALAVLRHAAELMEKSAEPDDPALHVAHAQLALALLPDGDDAAEKQADALARQVIAGCAEQRDACAKARAYAHGALLILADDRGDTLEAMRQASAAVADNERGFGKTHVETAMALTRLALLQRKQGLLQDAGLTMERAHAIAAHATLRRGDDRSLRIDYALVMADLGRLQAARDELDRLLAQPAEPAERVVQQRLLAQMLLTQGLLAPALAAADTAMGIASASHNTWEAALARQARARALSALGRHEDARLEMLATLADLRAQHLPEDGVQLLRARRFAGEIALRSRDDAAARAWLEPLVAAHRRGPAATPLAPVDLAQVLDLLGTLARRRGDPAAAGLHAEAGALLANAALPEQHPLRLRNRLLAALARQPSAPDDVRDAAARLEATLPPGSAWAMGAGVWAGDPASWKNLVL